MQGKVCALGIQKDELGEAKLKRDASKVFATDHCGWYEGAYAPLSTFLFSPSRQLSRISYWF